MPRRFLAAPLIVPMLMPALPVSGQEGVIDRRDDAYLVDPESIAVVDAEDNEIGEIEGVLVDEDGMPAAFVVELDRAFFMDDHEVAVPLEALYYESNQYISRMTVEQLENLPEWDD